MLLSLQAGKEKLKKERRKQNETRTGWVSFAPSFKPALSRYHHANADMLLLIVLFSINFSSMARLSVHEITDLKR